MKMAATTKVRDEALCLRLQRATPSCVDCAKYLPDVDGWACCSTLNQGRKPEPLSSITGGHCDEFTYRTTQVPAEFWKD